jgi:nucleotide-binding universal stress UspA family protein
MNHKNDRLMVALDLSDTDFDLIRYAEFLIRSFESKIVYFVHVVPDFNVPDRQKTFFQEEYPSDLPLDERILAFIQDRIKSVDLGKNDVERSVKVVEGKPYVQLLHWADIKKIDLLVVGKKNTRNGSGVTAKRVARHTRSSVVFVPEDVNSGCKNILVPIDFSKLSFKAFRIAYKLKQKDPSVHLSCIFISELPPSNYYLSIQDYSDYSQVLLDGAKQSFRNFLEEQKIDSAEIETHFVNNKYSSIADQILLHCTYHQIDLIVMGAKGHSPFENILYGSETEKLVSKNFRVPVMILR